MRITRHEKEAERLEYEEWPALNDLPIAAVESPGWKGRYRSSEGPWTFAMEVDGVPATEPPNYRYHVELGEEDVAEILKGLPVQAARTVLDRLLNEGNPEVIGAVVGCVIAQLARRVPSRASDSPAARPGRLEPIPPGGVS